MEKSTPIDCIIVAAGEGKRLGSNVPKAFVDLGGKPLLLHSLECFNAHASINSIVLAVPPDMLHETEKILSAGRCLKKTSIVPGGKERWQSVQSGVMAASAPWVLVHDAARPFVSHAVIDSVLEKSKAANYDCVITVTPEVDTVRLFKDDRAFETVDRATLIRVGTPQLFKTSLLKNAFLKVETLGMSPTDEAMLMEACGIPVGIAWGDPLNFKITTKSDLMLAEALYARR